MKMGREKKIRNDREVAEILKEYRDKYQIRSELIDEFIGKYLQNDQ